MDIQHCATESELANFGKTLEYPLESGLEEYTRALQEDFARSKSVLAARANDIRILRAHPDLVEDTWQTLKSLSAAEKTLREHKTSETSTTAEGQILFQGPTWKPLNQIPYILTLLVFFKVWLAPVLGLLTPILLFFAPYLILITLMGVQMPWDVYVRMMKQMVLGIDGSQPWGFKQYGQVAWTLTSIGQSMVMPIMTAIHTTKLDATLVKRGQAVQLLCRKTAELFEKYQRLGVLKQTRLQVPTAPSDVRAAVAWYTDEPLVLKILWKLLGKLCVTTQMARDRNWHAVDWTAATDSSLQLTALSDLAIPSSKAVESSLALKQHSLLTGPNRGGKSSSLRAVLQQVLLGQLFGMTYKATGSWKPFHLIFTRLKSRDHAGKESLFEMEVRMAARMLHTTQRRQVPTLILIDELFHSTNPPDAETSAKLFLEQLWTIPTAKSIISTHIFSLCETAGCETIQTLCCPATEREDGSIDYSYRLDAGICRVSSVREVLSQAGLVALKQNQKTSPDKQ